MTPDAIEACARYIERLEAEIRRWHYVYHTLVTGEVPQAYTGCTVCGAKHKARGFCQQHYEQWRKVCRYRKKVGRK